MGRVRHRTSYGYDGHEYWVSFEQNTPLWHERGRPGYLQSYFSKFQKAAGWFRNIAWPITHAILPRYLQLQFARALYDARLQFARMQNPIGSCRQAHAWYASSRFQEFLEQEELAGRIVLALLEQRTVQGQSPIYAPTLARIVAFPCGRDVAVFRLDCRLFAIWTAGWP